MRTRTLFVVHALLWLLLAAAAMWAASANAADPPKQREKIDLVTYRGGSSISTRLVWKDVSSPLPDYWNFLVLWYERPKGNKAYRFTPSQVTRVNATTFEATFPLLGAGTFTYQIQGCYNAVPPATEPQCSVWANSTDPQYALVDNQPRGWQVYGYLEPVGGVVVPAAAPSSSPPSGPEK